MTGSNAAEIITSNIDAMMDALEFGEALACWERLQRYMERKKLEIETLADAEPELPDHGPKERNKLKEQQLARQVAESVTRCGPVNGEEQA